MDKLINHFAGKGAHNRHFKKDVEGGKLRKPSAPFEVPLLTSTNYPVTILETIMGDSEPLFVVDRRSKWSWLEKVISAKEQCARFKADGHKFFIYLDSDDGFMWQAPTLSMCEKICEGRDVVFQRSRGFPWYRWFKGKMPSILGHDGPCAGAYIARTEHFEEYCEIIIRLDKVQATLTRAKGQFDDQAAWKTMVAVCNDKLAVDAEYYNNRESYGRYLTRDITRKHYDEIL
tara:strand:+ start:43 stop:735 length:693 start_codon:yes stop_codon:yes gene_type:complete